MFNCYYGYMVNNSNKSPDRRMVGVETIHITFLLWGEGGGGLLQRGRGEGGQARLGHASPGRGPALILGRGDGAWAGALGRTPQPIHSSLDEYMNEWTKEWMKEWMNERIDEERMNELINKNEWVN